MSRQTRSSIDKALRKLEVEYRIYLDGIEGDHLGRKNFFAAGGYIDKEGILRHNIVFNYDIDYKNVEEKMAKLYNKGVMAGKSYEEYIAHELAHILPFQNCVTAEEYKKTREALKRRFVSGISKYADRTQDGTESLEQYIKPWRR